tara:strand:+ start:919 stop:1104 length:186 start_codon:yes stop_codon:yes gene_type:complete
MTNRNVIFLIILNKILDLSSRLLNKILRRRWFKLANKLVILRKKYVISNMLKLNKKENDKT